MDKYPNAVDGLIRRVWIPYRGHQIEERSRWNERLQCYRVFGWYIGNTIYHSLTDAQIAIDESVRRRREHEFWRDYDSYD